MKELFLAIFGIAALGGFFAYLIRQSIWTRYVLPLISRKPKLSVLFENGQNVLHIKKTTPRVLDDAVAEAMAAERQAHPYQYFSEPSYQNPFPELFEGSSSNKKIYNDLLDGYLEEKEKEYRNCLQGQIADEYMQPVKLVLRNDGVVASGNLDITLNICPNDRIYDLTAKTKKTGDSIEPPILMPEGVFPLLNYKKVPYGYTEWQFDAHIKEDLKFEEAPINHHKCNDKVFPPFYVDTRYTNKISIKITIIDSTVHDPIESEIVLFIDD